jgi:hypothetical protein
MSIKSKNCKQFYILLLYGLLAGTQIVSASTGKITGKVVDATNNQSLSLANIFVENTLIGTTSDTEGNYLIFLQPGIYSLKVTMMGYNPVILKNLSVNMGLTTIADFKLNPAVVEGKVVTVIAKENIIKFDVAASQTILQGSDVAAIPASNFKKVLDKQTGIQEVDSRGLFIRGQRSYDISLLVDGIETRENVDGQIYTRFNPDEIEQLEIKPGGFDASFGNATAGVINMVTKSGSDSYTGIFDYRQSNKGRRHFGHPIRYYWDKFYLEGWSNQYTDVSWKEEPANRWEMEAHQKSDDDPFKDRPELLKELYRYWMRDEATQYGNNSDFVINATFGGPVPLVDNTKFFSSYRREKHYLLYPGPTDHFFDQNAMIKITTDLTPNMKLSFNYRYIETKGCSRYDYYRDESQLGDLGSVNPDFQSEKSYVFEGIEQVAWSGYEAWPYTGMMGLTNRYRNNYALTFNHTISPRTFYEVKVLINNFHLYGRQGAVRDTSARVVLTDPGDPDYSVTLGGPLALAPLGYWEKGIDNPFNWILGGTYGYSENSYVRDISLRASLTSQIHRYHQFNAGFQYTYYDIKKRGNRDQPDRLGKWRWHVYPQHFAFWASDKFEFEGLIFTAGLRSDLRIPDEWFDWNNNVWDPSWDGSLPADSNKTGPRYKPPLKMVLAPRLSISHPIGETAKIFFNWGYYYQEQSFERLYLFWRREAIGQIHYGDPELPFRKKIEYEIGYEHNLLNLFRIAVSGYHKNVSNLLIDHVGYRTVESMGQEWPHFYTHGPNRYFNSQGIEARFEKLAGKFWSAWLNFNSEVFSRGVYGFTTFYEDTTTPPRELDYEEENKKRPWTSRINIGASFHTPARYGPKFLGFYPAGNLNLNLLYWWRQQPTFDYNPERVPAPYAPRDNKRWKPHWGVDLTFSKKFDFGTFITPVFYIEIYNLFNTKNMFRGAFDQNEPGLEKYVSLLEEAGAEPGERDDLAEEAIGNNPVESRPFNGSPYFLYLNPRLIWMGIRFEIK